MESLSVMPGEAESTTPSILYEAWEAYSDNRRISTVEHVRTFVSTNRVYRLRLSDGTSIVAKVSSYGSYYFFREDHDRIHQWYKLLQHTYYSDLLADAFLKEDRIFTHYDRKYWVIFYNEVVEKGTLPRILSDEQIVCLGREMALLHRECSRIAPVMMPMSRSMKSDIVYFLDVLGERHSAELFHLSQTELGFLRNQCEHFLQTIDDLQYDYWKKIPVLIDWNISNFSVEFDSRQQRFTLFSRWDYDWFRMEPKALDFYFFSRVVREEGDRTLFTYLPDTLLEDRFLSFLRAYNRILPLMEQDLLFLKEAYRFFILNYVIKDGEHFFKPALWPRLIREAVTQHLPRLDAMDFSPLLRVLDD